MRLRPLLVYILSALIWTARGVEAEKPVPEPQEEAQETVRVFEHAVTDSEAAELEHLIQRGQKTSCCGYWAERGAAKMQQLVARQLQISRRHLGDVHFDNITAVRAVRDEHSLWSGIAVLYLEDLESSQVQLQSDRHEVEILDVTRGSLVQVPEGAVLVHTKPLRVAWTRVRAPDAPMRGFFEFYLASWVQRHFVMPYDTTQQRKFFRKHTRHPRYWHGFLWSFVGTFCSVFACLPLAWFGVQALARASSGREDSSDEGLSPTLLPRVGRKLGQGKPERRESAPSFGKAFGIPTDRVKDASKS